MQSSMGIARGAIVGSKGIVRLQAKKQKKATIQWTKVYSKVQFDNSNYTGSTQGGGSYRLDTLIH